MPDVYLPLRADQLLPIHVHALRAARSHGQVTVGLLSGALRSSPLTWQERRALLLEMRGVVDVMRQCGHDCRDNLRQLRPAFVVAGEPGILGDTREGVIETLTDWGGRLLDPWAGNSPQLSARGRAPARLARMRSLRRLFDTGRLLRAIEAHNGLSAQVGAEACFESAAGRRCFDALWLGSLCDSTAKARPDDGSVAFSSRLATLHQLLHACALPILFDADDGGRPEQFAAKVRTLERQGVSAIVAEDKRGAKRNSLLAGPRQQLQERAEVFAAKLAAGVAAKTDPAFMVIARIESLVLDAGVDDALERAQRYVDAGADGVLIHARQRDPSELFAFCDAYARLSQRVPLVVVPTAFPQVDEQALEGAGVRLVIYANHLLRSAYPAMLQTARSLLRHGRAAEAEQSCLPIQQLLRLCNGAD